MSYSPRFVVMRITPLAIFSNTISNKYIKQYTFKKGDAIDPNKIIEEVDKHQEEIIKDIELSIVKLMNNISKVYDKKEELNSDDLSKLQFLISKLENEKK